MPVRSREVSNELSSINPIYNWESIVKKFIFLMALCLGYSGISHSLEAKYLTSGEVQSLASGKVWSLVRTNDKKAVRWEIKPDGYIFADNRTTPTRDTGKWSVSAKDQLCVRWKGQSADNCYLIQQEGEKYNLFSPGNLKTPASIATVQ
jgi:hypothetical protein